MDTSPAAPKVGVGATADESKNLASLEKQLTRTSSDPVDFANMTKQEREDYARQIKIANIEEESGHDIQFKTMSWQKTAALLFAEYICLAILSFPWAFSYLGFVGGVLITLFIGLITLYTSYILWQYCMIHPEVRDICDIGYLLAGKRQWAYEATMIGLILNNIFVMALHVLTGSKIINTLSGHAACTVGFAAVAMVICIIASLPRTLEQVSIMGIVSAIFMGTAVLVTLVFAGIQGEPAGYTDALGPVYATAAAPKGTTFVQALNAVLNITFTFIGQICYPSFIAEMKDPREFPKALYAITIAEFVVFIVAGAVGYHFLGQYTQAPAIGSLSLTYRKAAFGLTIVPTVVIGVIYASVVARMVFFRIFRNSHHRHSNTFTAWATWVGLIFSSWLLAFIIAQVIPFFSDLLSVMSALFDSWFGAIFWGFAFLEIHQGKWWKSARRSSETIFNFFIIFLGILMLVVGLYASIQGIINGRSPRPCSLIR